MEENREQEVIRDRQEWCGCQRKKEEEAVWSREAKV